MTKRKENNTIQKVENHKSEMPDILANSHNFDGSTVITDSNSFRNGSNTPILDGYYLYNK